MLVSQFTLYYTLKGTKPDFHHAMDGEKAKELYDFFLAKLAAEYHAVQKQAKAALTQDPVLPGAFGQYMVTEMVSDGPVTLVMESSVDEKARKKYENTQLRLAKQAE